MNVKVHFPTDETNRQELENRAAEIHGNAVLNYIKNLPCSLEQKKELLSKLTRCG